VARTADGHFAATLSTGGTSVTLCGRVGDVPIFGCGLYAGPAGAVACTGEGEQIIRRTLARAVYERIERGTPAPQAVEEAVRMFPERWDVGVIAVDRSGWGVAANRPMAYGVGN
jgi:isoaspartyl peptidase/L-asparaginase-like protein (Ntn-hydrolase superfamily)